MTVDLVIKDCWVVNHDGRTKAGVAIDGGRIVAIAEDSDLPMAHRTVDAGGNYLLPGLIDPHQHLGFVAPIDQDWRSETRSAAVGGVTTVFNYLWHEDSYVGHFDEDLRVAEANSLVDFGFEVLMISPDHSNEIEELAGRGVGGFKWFTCYKGEEGRPWGINACDDGTIYDGFRRVAQLGPSACAKVHVENIELISTIREAVIASGRSDLAAWADSRPGFTEASDMMKTIYHARHAGVRLVILHISSAEGVDVLVAGKQGHANDILGETCPHYLSLTKHADVGVRAKVIPPVQDRQDQDRLWWAIENGFVTSIGSDHAPTTLRDKQGNVWDVKQGFPGVAMILPIMLHEGVNKRGLSLEKVVAVTSYNNARWYGRYPRKGTISVGSDADLVLIDLDKKVTVTPELLQSNSDYCLHDGWELQGWPIMTIVRGQLIVDGGRILAEPGWGTYQPVRALMTGHHS
jgi:dihydroorotase-like cyclic amidohydrolase